MLPPVLEIYVIWHPSDGAGRAIAEELVEHFHGTLFSGLIGGAIEVYVRSSDWRAYGDAPRPIPFSAQSSPAGIREARFVAVVPIAGNELAAAVQAETSPWRGYFRAIVAAHDNEPQRVGIFPYLLDEGALSETLLGDMISRFQRIAANPVGDGENSKSSRCRDLAQGIAQLLARTGDGRLTVFISHTKRNSPGQEDNVGALIGSVREVIRETRLREFFDASDLQPGHDWDSALRSKAATSALLAIRTDLYPSREWCQREILIAKRAGMPVIIMDALESTEERGSFLMDHVPRVPVRMVDGQWRKADIYLGLNLLVDECLKRVVWQHQAHLAKSELELQVAWWAPHAPEPITLSEWLSKAREAATLPSSGDLVILHPDPPLGPEEKSVLQELVALGDIHCTLDIMTPRLLAARNG